MKNLVKAIAIFAMMIFGGLGVFPLYAQQTTVTDARDYWKSRDEARAATNSPFYSPTIKKVRALEKNEVIKKMPAMIVLLNTPDRIGGQNWVRTEDGREYVCNKTTLEPLRLAECFNLVHSWELISRNGKDGAPGKKGETGATGATGATGEQGQDGKNAETKKMPLGTKILVGALVTVVGGFVVAALQPKDKKGNGNTISGSGDTIPKIDPFKGGTAFQGHPGEKHYFSVRVGVKF